MMLKLLSLQWKETVRSAFWEKNLVTNILLGLVALYFALNFLVLGIFLDRILLKIFPDSDPFFIFNRFVLYYLLFDLFMRFMVQQFPTLAIQPYLHLPIPKKKLFHYLLIKSVPNFFNWVPFLLIIPFFIKVVVPNYGIIQNVAWLLAITGLVLNNNFVSYYFKKIFSVRAYVPLIILLGIAVLFYFDVQGYLGLSQKFGDAFSYLMESPFFVLIPIVLLAISYGLVFKMMKKFAYLEDLSIQENNKETITSEISLLKQYGTVGELIQLQIKLIWRNKRPKLMVMMGLIFPLYFVFMFLGNDELLDSTAWLIFAGIFITGMVALNYGQFLLAWESSFFDFLLTKNLSFKDYFEAIYLILGMATGFLTIVLLPLIFFDFRLGMGILCMGIFNIGVTNLLMLAFGIFNKKRIDLSKGGLFNYEGTSAVTFIFMIPIFVIPMVLFYLFEAFGASQNLGLILLGLIGLLMILFRNVFLNLIYNKFKTIKYESASGFRKK